VFLPLMVDGWLCPGNVNFSLNSSGTQVAQLENLQWALHIAISGFIILDGMPSAYAQNPRRKPFNSVLLMASGAIEFALAMKKRSINSGQGAAETFMDIVGPLSEIAKPLTFVKNAYVKGALGVLDAVSDVGGGAVHFINGLTMTSVEGEASARRLQS